MTGSWATPASLDHLSIRKRQLDIGLDDAHFHQLTGMYSGHLHTLGPRDISLQMMVRISAALDMPLDALVAAHPDEPAAAPPPQPQDSAVVGAAVALFGTVDVDELAEVLGWPISRILTAAAHLQKELDSTGQRLANVDGELQLTATPNTLTSGLRDRLTRVQQVRFPLHPNDARDLVALVRDHILGSTPARSEEFRLIDDYDFYTRGGQWDADHVTHLGALGIIAVPPEAVRNADGDPRMVTPHPDLLFALGLLPEPTLTAMIQAAPPAPGAPSVTTDLP